MSADVTNPTQFSAYWKNPETGEMEGVSDEQYNANRAALKKTNQAAEAHALERGDRWFKEG